MTYIIKILTYCIIGALIYNACREKRVRLRLVLSGTAASRAEPPRISLISILALSVLFGWYSSSISSPFQSMDRANYAIRFTRNWPNPWSFGLNRVSDFVHLFSNEPSALFFTISVLCCVLLLFAYRISREGRPEAMLLTVSSSCLLYSCYLLKQAPAIALGTIAILLLLQKRYLLSALFTFCAILFHESALILLPLYGLLLFSRNKWMRILSYLAMALMLFIFSGLSRFSFVLIQRFMPDLYEQSAGYLDSSGAIGGGALNFATILKGFPFYLITAYGFFRRGMLRPRIPAYDQYLTLCAFSSLGSVLSSIMYWMWRFSAYCYFPVFIFAAELHAVNPFKREAKTFMLLCFTSLAFFTLRYLCQIFFLYGGF